MASSTHTLCRFCACAVQTKHYTTLFSPGGLNKHLSARMVKLYKVPISYIASLCSFFRTMSPRLTEDRAYDRTRLSREQPSLQKQKRTRAMITYSFTECFTKQFTKNYEYPDFGYFRKCKPASAWPLPRTCLPARPGYEAKL